MEAAKRMYDNSYNQRQETASLAKAYLNDTAPKVETPAIKKKKGHIICNVFGIIASIGYCLIILGLLLMPLVRETQMAQLKIEENQYKIDIARLEESIRLAAEELEDKKNMMNIEQVAMEKLGLVRKSDVTFEQIKTNRYFTLNDAKDAYYNTNFEFSASDN